MTVGLNVRIFLYDWNLSLWNRNMQLEVNSRCVSSSWLFSGQMQFLHHASWTIPEGLFFHLFLFFLSSFFLNVFAEALICILNWNQTRLYKSQAFIQYIFSQLVLSPPFPFCSLALPSFFCCKIQSSLQIYFLSSTFALPPHVKCVEGEF